MPLLVLFTLIFTSCQKENIQKELRPISDKTALDKLKAFYKSETSTTSKNNAVTSFRPDRGEPDWEKTMYAVEEGKYILPVQINKREINEDINANKYLVISEKEGKLTGFFYYAISKAKLRNSLQIGNVLTAINVFDRKQQNLVKDIGITKVGINGSQALDKESMADNKQFHNFMGYRIKSSDVRAGKGSGNEIVNNYVEPESCTAGGGTVVEIEWWYQEYDQHGNVTFEEYVYSTFECWGGTAGGGGGGGGSPTSEQICQMKMDQFIADGHATSNLISEETVYEDAGGMNVVYNWGIFNAFTWGLISYEDATITKIPVIHGGYIREYSSFTHRTIAAIGVSIGGTRTFQDLGATINKTQTRAQVRIDYSVTSSVADGCILPPLTNLYNANREFRIINEVSGF